jgi:hypothetical protein
MKLPGERPEIHDLIRSEDLPPEFIFLCPSLCVSHTFLDRKNIHLFAGAHAISYRRIAV